MEGGNLAYDGHGFCSECDDLSLLTTFHDITKGHFGNFNMTSAAMAQAAWLAAQIQNAYPNIWPETVRAYCIQPKWPEQLKHNFDRPL